MWYYSYWYYFVSLSFICKYFNALQWRHNDHDDVSNHQPHGCLLNRFFQVEIKEKIKAPRHWPLCGKFTGTGEFPAQMASNAENVSIWWRHHGYFFPFLLSFMSVLISGSLFILHMCGPLINIHENLNFSTNEWVAFFDHVDKAVSNRTVSLRVRMNNSNPTRIG